MKKPVFSLSQLKDERIVQLADKNDHKTLAVWAKDCVERILPYYEEKFPEDLCPRKALETLQSWIDSGVFRMAVIRGASLAAHAAAREIGEDNAARSAARAAGQAVASAHVPGHCVAAAIYALQAVYRAAGTPNASAATAEERDWQYRRLIELIKTSG